MAKILYRWFMLLSAFPAGMKRKSVRGESWTDRAGENRNHRGGCAGWGYWERGRWGYWARYGGFAQAAVPPRKSTYLTPWSERSGD